LCIDGVEISNPNRTIAYLRNQGGHMLAGGPGQFAVGDCGCPEFDPDGACSIAVRIYGDWSSPGQFCGGIEMLTGNYYDYIATTLVAVMGPAPMPVRPPMPPLDDPAWVPTGSFLLAEPLGGCTTDPEPTEFAAYYRLVLTNIHTGAVAETVQWTSGVTVGPGEPPGSLFSFDGGVTWLSPLDGPPGATSWEATYVYEDLPCASTPGWRRARLFVTADENALMVGQLYVSSLAGPITTEVRAYPSAAPVLPGDMPPLNDAGWLTLAPAMSAPNAMAAGGAWAWDGVQYVDVPGDGFYWTHVIDANGEELDFIAAVSYSEFAPGVIGSYYVTADGGATWTQITDLGLPLLEFGSQPPEPEFTTPVADDAPWYDDRRPESADVLGVWINDWTLSSPHKRQKDDRTWGSSIGSTKYVGRELVIAGVVFTTSCKATEYAKQWLYEALNGGCVGGPCGLPEGVIYTACPEGTDDTSTVRTLKRLGLISYDPMEGDEDFPCCWGFRFEATLATEAPFMYHEPVTQYRGPLVPADQEPACNICTPCPPLPAVSPLVCGCADVPVKVVPEPDPDDCWCNPVQINRISVPIAAPAFWTDATAIIKITAGFDTNDPGDPGIRNLRIRAWQNPVALPGPPLGSIEGFNCQDPCMEIDVACIPRGATLTIDGTTRRATISNNGGEVNGYPYLSSDAGGARFEWPEVSCDGLMVAIDSDAFDGHTAPDSTIEIQMVGLDRG